jgi:hypothetical protein
VAVAARAPSGRSRTRNLYAAEFRRRRPPHEPASAPSGAGSGSGRPVERKPSRAAHWHGSRLALARRGRPSPTETRRATRGLARRSMSPMTLEAFGQGAVVNMQTWLRNPYLYRRRGSASASWRSCHRRRPAARPGGGPGDRARADVSVARDVQRRRLRAGCGGGGCTGTAAQVTAG